MVLLSTGIFAALVASTFASPSWRFANQTTCKCYPDDSCWPTESRWQALNQAVQGRLTSVIPSAAACYPTFNNISTASVATCDTVKANWTNADWIVDQPVQIFSNFWNNNSCSADAKCGSSCQLGLSPQMVVVANNQFDVQVSVNFARIQSLRLVLRNTGLDYLGRSSGYGALALNTHHLSNIQFIKSYAGPGNYSGGAVKVGAGVMFRDLYPAAKSEGIDIVGSHSPTIGIAGGYIQGGGYSPLSGIYGLDSASDNVLAFNAILASGKQVQINSGSYPDLFWALKGGGPSTFAAITAVTVKTFPAVPCTGASLNISYAQASFWKGVAAFHNYSSTLVDAGFYASYKLTRGSGLTVQSFVAPNTTGDELGEVLRPLFTQLDALEVTYSLSKLQSYPTLFDLQNSLSPQTEDFDGENALVGGRLISKSDATTHSDAINNALQTLVEAGHSLAGHMVNPGHALPDPDASISAVHPVWRSSAYSLMWFYKTDECLNEAGRIASLYNVTQAGNALREASPSSAVYVNEGDVNEPNWQQAFWGTNYKKLNEMKMQYDPDGIFWAQSTPGSESWVLQDEKKLCKTQ